VDKKVHSAFFDALSSRQKPELIFFNRRFGKKVGENYTQLDIFS